MTGKSFNKIFLFVSSILISFYDSIYKSELRLTVVDDHLYGVDSNTEWILYTEWILILVPS